MDTLFVLMTITSIHCISIGGYISRDCSEGTTSVNYSPPITRSICATLMKSRHPDVSTTCVQLPVVTTNNKKKK